MAAQQAAEVSLLAIFFKNTIIVWQNRQSY
jgi:hypothetical protein